MQFILAFSIFPGLNVMLLAFWKIYHYKWISSSWLGDLALFSVQEHVDSSAVYKQE